MVFVRLAAVALALSSSLAACGGQGSATDGGTVGTSTVIAACASDPRVTAYAPGMVEPGAGGIFKVRLDAATPAPPARGANEWVLTVEDGKGAAVDGATLAVKPFMPDHGHGASVVPTVVPQGSDGKYTVSNISLVMAGVWTLTFTITKGGQSDTAVFGVCLPS